MIGDRQSGDFFADGRPSTSSFEYQAGDIPGARRELEWVAKLAPCYPDALVQLADVAARQGDLADARARIDQALGLDPANQRAASLEARLTRAPEPRPSP